MEGILQVKNLTTEIRIKNNWYTVVDDISFTLNKGETVGIVGESGCGKTFTSLSIMGLLTKDVSRISNGQIIFKNDDLVKLSESQMEKIRGKELAMIFQDPALSLNPVLKIGYQIEEVLMRHLKLSRKLAKERALDLLKNMGITSPKSVYKKYPFQLSGGMCQRVMIAISMSCNPQILIADEPTTALDVTIQAQILDLIGDLKKEFGTSVILISHNLGVIAKTCDLVMIMYRGQIVEKGSTKKVLENPLHPYTKALFQCIPTLDGNKKLEGIPLTVPPLDEAITGCSFAERCKYAQDTCKNNQISLAEKEEDHFSRCILNTF